jgi:hypothetical protein
MSSITATYTSGQNLLEGLNSFLTVGHTTAPVYTTANALTTFTPGTGWTGNDTAGYVHATGNTATLTESTLLTIGTTYTLNITVTSYTSGSISYSVGGFSSATIISSYTRTFVATATTALTITPTTDFVGTILLSLVATPVSNGYIDDAIGTASSVWELITITLTSPTAFTVGGSSSGSLGTGTVGTLFSSSVAVFTVTAGTTAFAANDVIQLQMTAPWTALVHSQAAQYTWQTPGNDNNGGATVGLLCSSNATTNYFNAQVVMYPVWQPALAEASQWKRYAGAYWTLGPAAGQACTLYAVADGRFCYACCLIGSTYSSACFGWMDATNTPDQHPQPLLIGGNATTAVTWADSSSRSPVFPVGYAPWTAPQNSSATGVSATRFLYCYLPSGRLCGLSGAYDAYSESASDIISISSAREGARLQTNLDNTIPLFPITIMTTNTSAIPFPSSMAGIWGKIPFVKVIPCNMSDGSLIGGGVIFRNNLTRRKYITIQNGYITDTSNTYAMELA